MRKSPIIEIPFGIEDIERRSTDERENIILWGGGTWEWLDPATAVEAVVEVNRRRRRLPAALPRALAAEPRTPSTAAAKTASTRCIASGGAVRRGQRRVDAVSRSPVVAAPQQSRYHASPSDGGGRVLDSHAAVRRHRGGGSGHHDREGIRGRAGERQRVWASSCRRRMRRRSRTRIERLIRDDAFYAACVSNLIRIQPRFAWDVVTRPLVEAVKQWQRQPER